MTVDQLRGSAFPKRAMAWEEVGQGCGEVPPPRLLGETSPLPPLVSEVSHSADDYRWSESLPSLPRAGGIERVAMVAWGEGNRAAVLPSPP